MKIITYVVFLLIVILSVGLVMRHYALRTDAYLNTIANNTASATNATRDISKDIAFIRKKIGAVNPDELRCRDAIQIGHKQIMTIFSYFNYLEHGVANEMGNVPISVEKGEAGIAG